MGSAHTVLIGSDGSVRLPEEVRERLGLSAGSRVLIDLDSEGDVRLRPLLELPQVIEKDGVMLVRSAVEGHLSDIEISERDARLADLAGMPLP